jgi:arylsulfatase
MVNAMGPYNAIPETMAAKLQRVDEIGGPNSHGNVPIGWAMAANTPLKRYKQNTHGGGIRDPLVVCWPKGLPARGELRHHFCHACDVVPTLLDLIGVAPPAAIDGVAQQPIDGESFYASLRRADVPARRRAQYFEMFGHRGLWLAGWKAVAYHPPATPFDADRWELYHLDRDFSETDDRADSEPERLAAMIACWWQEAERCNVLPLDDRFGARFAENARRAQGGRRRFVFHAGMGHVPTEVAPDLRARSYEIEAEVEIPPGGAEGVLIAHGDTTSGYSLYVAGGRLVHDLNIGGSHQIVRSSGAVPAGRCRLGFRMARAGGHGTGTLTINGEACGSLTTKNMFRVLISWSGLDVGRDRGSPVSHYAAPFAFTGRLLRVTVNIAEDQALDGAAAARAEMGRQ